MLANAFSGYRGDLNQIASLDVGHVLWDEPLCNHCNWRIGGPADLLVEPTNVDQIKRLAKAISAYGIPLVIIGQGTNLLFDDGGVRGVVMKIGGRMAGVELTAAGIIVEAGAWVPGFARFAGKAGLTGFEHTAGIPGTLGGLILMNGGSQRKNIGENVARVWAVTLDGQEICLDREQCSFSYRHSALQGNRYIVVKVELVGTPGDPKSIRREMLGILRERRTKFPLKLPNCGSVFLSDPGNYATVGPPGKIIEAAGLKGLRIGDAEVSVKHANFIINTGQATARDVLALISEIRRRVRYGYGVDLCCEVRHVDSQGRIQSAEAVIL